MVEFDAYLASRNQRDETSKGVEDGTEKAARLDYIYPVDLPPHNRAWRIAFYRPASPPTVPTRWVRGDHAHVALRKQMVQYGARSPIEIMTGQDHVFLESQLAEISEHGATILIL